MGDFKRGKSTLINALTGQDVAPVDVQPETMSINRIEYAEEFIAQAHKAGAKADYVILKGLKHYSSIHNVKSADDPTFKLVLQFVRKSR